MSDPNAPDAMCLMTLYTTSFNGITDAIEALEAVVHNLKSLQATTEDLFMRLTGIDEEPRL